MCCMPSLCARVPQEARQEKKKRRIQRVSSPGVVCLCCVLAQKAERHADTPREVCSAAASSKTGWRLYYQEPKVCENEHLYDKNTVGAMRARTQSRMSTLAAPAATAARAAMAALL